MCRIVVLAGTPILSKETVTISYDLRVKVSCEFGPVIRESADSKVSTKEGGGKIDILYTIETKSG